jgi:hypothetical protein
VEFAGGCVCIGFACIDASRWNFPVCPVNDKAIVFHKQNCAICPDGNHPYRWPGIINHMVMRNDRPIWQLHIILVKADPLTLMDGPTP